jgi:hypothetical protein
MCNCIWLLNGYHSLAGRVNGKDCVHPQPQAWSDDPTVQLQRDGQTRT